MDNRKAFTPLETMVTRIPLRGNVEVLTGFTIVELLTSIIIIALLMGLLLPSIAMIRRSAKEAAQKAQFATMDMAIEAFRQDFGDYPPSNLVDGAGSTFAYCGAQKLTEALLGWDLMGFHPKTIWSRNGQDTAGNWIYASTDPNLRERKGPYLEVAKTNIFRLGSTAVNTNDGLYNYNDTTFNTLFDRTRPNYVICDVFGIKKVTDALGKTVKAGTPVLYYKANTNSKAFYCTFTSLSPENSIYNLYDNLPLLALGMLPNATTKHYLFPPPDTFCNRDYKIVDTKVPSWIVSNTTCYWPNRPDTYILISAGADHNFGTSDDILNF